MGGNVGNKLLNTKSLLTMPSNVLPLCLKQTFPPTIWTFIEGEGDEIESTLSSNLNLFNFIWLYLPIKKKLPINILNCLLRDAVQAVVQDLTQTLTKDIKKRMCETLGFYLFEKWWQEQETKYKEKVVHIIILPNLFRFSNKSVSFFFSSIQTCHQRPRAPLAIIRSSQPLHLSVKLLLFPKKSLLQNQVYLGYPVSRTSRAFLTSKGRAWRRQAVSVRVLD